MNTTRQESQPKKLSEEGLDMSSLPAEILGKILTFCQVEDAIKLRATCSNTKIQKETDAFLYRTSMEKVKKEQQIKFARRFLDGRGFYDNKWWAWITLVHDGKYRSKEEIIESCVEKLRLSSEEKTRAINELSEKEECYERCYKCQGRYGSPQEKKLKIQEKLTRKEAMDVWKQFYGNLEDWQESYLGFKGHAPENKREALQPVREIQHLLFGLFLGSQDSGLTSIEYSDFDFRHSHSSKQSFILLSGKQGERFHLRLATISINKRMTTETIEQCIN